MKNIKIELTLEELTLLASLASDQLFRREFIDPKMPGYSADPAEVRLGKALVARMLGIIEQRRGERGSSPAAAAESVLGGPSKRAAGSNGSL